MQKDDPPTHLIRSTKGDYLRARLIEMDDKTLTVEVRAETRRLPRESVTRIIWLHHEESGRDALKANGEDASTAARVQAVRDSGIRLTFLPETLNSATLCGTSDVLGACRVALADIDQLILGSAIEQAATGLPYQRWKLQQAIEPKFAGGDGEQGGRPGEESALVGKPAPDFELATLDGQRFRLSGQRGKVVVLDFWATWCGPCIQTLPQIVRVAKECEDQNVLLVAVNLQETPEAITKALERLKLKMTVALDSDGVVAQQYAAVAIPQTVIIDSAGNVAGLFVGGGPQYGDQVRDTLRSVLGPAKK
jgi:peroxiredoxin